MSASATNCGPTLHGYLAMVSDVLITKGAPQVHTHVLTDAEDFALIGHRRFELCCHGCGHSVLILHDDGDTKKASQERDIFLEVHRRCKDLGFETWCPDVRTNFSIIDLRKRTNTPFKGSKGSRLTRTLTNGKSRNGSKEDGA